MTCWMGIDIGGTLVKAAIFDSDGKVLAVERASTRLLTPNPSQTERDMDELYEQICEVSKKAIQSAGLTGNEIAGVACTGHGKGLYLWGKDNRPVRNGIISTDSRAAEYVMRWRSDKTEERAREISCQKIMVSQPCALLRWLKDNERESYDNIEWVFEAKDYIRFRLTGKAYAEKTDYSGTSLMNLKTGSFDPALFSLFGIEEMADKLPPVCNSFDLCGEITQESARLTGLAAGTPVAAGMFDIDACALAMGILNGDDLCVIAGTWGINEFISPAPVLDGSIAMNSYYCMPEYYLIEESSPTSAGNLEWLANNIFDLDKSQAKERGESVYQIFDRIVEELPPEKCGVYYLPYIFGGSTNPMAKGCFIGLDGGDSKKHMIRAVFEGVVYCHYEHIERLLAARPDNPPKKIRLGGGAARSEVWVQMYADVIGLPVQVMQGDELGALGCAVNASVARGHFDSIEEGVEAMVHSSRVVQPNPAMTAVYREKYKTYRHFADALDPVWGNKN